METKIKLLKPLYIDGAIFQAGQLKLTNELHARELVKKGYAILDTETSKAEEEEEKARLEAEAKAKQEADEKARLESEAKAKVDEEEKARLEAEAKAKSKK